jgi:hypothetical protein
VFELINSEVIVSYGVFRRRSQADVTGSIRSHCRSHSQHICTRRSSLRSVIDQDAIINLTEISQRLIQVYFVHSHPSATDRYDTTDKTIHDLSLYSDLGNENDFSRSITE